MTGGYISCLEGSDAADEFVSQLVANFDRVMADALSGRSFEEATEHVRSLGFTETADRLHLYRALDTPVRISTGDE